MKMEKKRISIRLSGEAAKIWQKWVEGVTEREKKIYGNNWKKKGERDKISANRIVIGLHRGINEKIAKLTPKQEWKIIENIFRSSLESIENFANPGTLLLYKSIIPLIQMSQMGIIDGNHASKIIEKIGEIVKDEENPDRVLEKLRKSTKIR